MTTGAEPMDVHDPRLPNPPPGQDDLPCEDGEPMDSPTHRRQMSLLIDSLVAAFPDRDDMYVGGNMFVWYSELQTKKKDVRGPDVFVVLGAIPGRKRKSWVVWEEGKLPDVVIELTSESTEHIDRGEKMRIYERVWHLPEYFLFDPERKTLEGWRLEGERFVPIPADAAGELECRVLGLRLGVRDGWYQREQTSWLRWIDPASGHVLPTEREIALSEKAKADEAQAKAADAQAKAADAQARAADAQAKAADAQARAADAQAKAAEETARAEAAIAELARLKALIEGR